MKKKRNLYIIAFLCFITLVGVTIAYLQSTDTFENIFNSGTYKTVTHEEFTSPDNWAPGDTIPKTITTTNQGTIPVRVRVKLTETWTSLDNDNLDICIERSTEPDTFGNCIEKAAIINLTNTEDWIKDGDYYYYVGELNPNETTTSLIQSVTFNPTYQGDVTCTTVGNVKTCESSSSGYSGGTYTLNITTETVQSDAYQSVWNLLYDPAIERTIYDISDNNEYGTYEATNKNIFLRKTMLGETPSLQEVGFIINGNAYYLKGAGATYNEELVSYNDDSIYYNENKTTLLNAFGSENCTDYTTYITCQAASVYAGAYDDGHVYASGDDWNCNVNSYGFSECDEGAGSIE